MIFMFTTALLSVARFVRIGDLSKHVEQPSGVEFLSLVVGMLVLSGALLATGAAPMSKRRPVRLESKPNLRTNILLESSPYRIRPPGNTFSPEAAARGHTNQVQPDDGPVSSEDMASTVTVPSEPELARHQQLDDRLKSLEKRLDELKVMYALGRISAVGYQQAKAKLDDERSQVELLLMENPQ